MKFSIHGLVLLLLVQHSYGNDLVNTHVRNKNNRIVIVIRFTPEYIRSLHPYHQLDLTGDSILFRTAPVKDRVEMKQLWTEHKLEVEKNTVRLTITSDKLITVEAPFWRTDYKTFNPGDSICITYSEKQKKCNGKGSENFYLQEKLNQLFLNVSDKWVTGWINIKSLGDYLSYMKFCDDRISKAIQIMDGYKKHISNALYDHIKKECVYGVEFGRVEAFLWMMGQTAKEGSLKPLDWTAISDSTLDGAWSKWLRSNNEGVTEIGYFYHYNRIQVWKKFHFDWGNEQINTEAKRRSLYYNTLKGYYKGLLRERLLQYVLAEEVIKDLGYNHLLTTSLLKDYYHQPGFTQYKQWMKVFEKKAAVLYVDRRDKSAPDFSLIDSSGDVFSSKKLNGKLVLLDFWFSGCTGCVQMTPMLQKVEEAFAGDTGIVFVSVSTDRDKDRWLKSVEQKKYTTGNGLNLYTGGKGASHDMMQDYNISSYPELYMIDAWGQILFPVPDPRKDSGEVLINKLKKLRACMDDGPYVLYKGNDSMVVASIHAGKLDSSFTMMLNKKDVFKELDVMTDEFPRSFKVLLKPFLKNEPVEYTQPEKLLVLSDIEGNFDALRKILQKNGIMDSLFNWTFNNGHLVLIGDMVDRGEQVMECLWLIYALEEKAKQQGGYVHFILGNHEILNMSGDLRYVQEKYKANAKLLQEPYKDLLGEKSELGRWLRTKNIMEKIGDLLFAHGGISREVNELPLSLQQINDYIRPHYASRDEFKENQNRPELRVLFNSQVSPFWYRGYFKGTNQENIIDSSLQKFSVNRIIIGHTIIADSISAHFDGKIINTDVHHAKGKSEALLIERNKYYRVNTSGEKKPLKLSDNFRSTALKSKAENATE